MAATLDEVTIDELLKIVRDEQMVHVADRIRAAEIILDYYKVLIK